MSYLAQGIQQGWQSGTAAVEARRKRKQDDKLEAVRRDLELERQAREHQNQKVLQDARITFEGSLAKENRAHSSTESEKGRAHSSAESEKGRAHTLLRDAEGRKHQTSERVDAQGYQSTQQRLKEAADLFKQSKDHENRRELFNLGLPLQGAALGLQMRKQEWEENPLNPYNRIRQTQAERNEQDLDMPITTHTGSPPPVSGQFRPTAPAGGRNVTIDPPPAAVDMLRKNPVLAGAFDAKYGQGAAARYLQAGSR